MTDPLQHSANDANVSNTLTPAADENAQVAPSAPESPLSVAANSPTEPTAPVIKEPRIQEPVIGPATTTGRVLSTSMDAAARKQLPAPEDKADALLTSGKAKQEEMKAPVTAPAKGSVVVMANVYKTAEENLAAHVAQHLAPQLTGTEEQPLMLTLLNEVTPSSTTNTTLKICLKGPMVSANYALMSHEVLEALVSHPAIAPIVKNGENGKSASAPMTLYPQTIDPATGESMLHITLDNLSPESYAALIQEMAKPVAVVAPAAPVTAASTPKPTLPEPAADALAQTESVAGPQAAEAAQAPVVSMTSSPLKEAAAQPFPTIAAPGHTPGKVADISPLSQAV